MSFRNLKFVMDTKKGQTYSVFNVLCEFTIALSDSYKSLKSIVNCFLSALPEMVAFF